MQTPSRRIAAAAALAALVAAAGAGPARAFQVGSSSDFPNCRIWLNEQGQPLRNVRGREIGRKVPCANDAPHRDAYEALPGAAAGTLVVRDASHRVECLLALRPGSSTVMVQKLCQAWHD